MKQPAYSLRQALPGEADKVSRLIREAMLTYSKESGISPDILESMHESVESVAYRIENNYCLCLFDGDNPEATITLSICDTPLKYSFSEKTEEYLSNFQKAVYISRFAVSDKLRGTGLGIHLIQQASEYANHNKANVLLLHTAKSNKIMTAFYENRGFEIIDIESSRHYERALFGMKVKRINK